jgi:uncharacterized protein (TIGR03000 family)
MFTNRIVGLATGAVALVAMLSAVGPSEAQFQNQQGWPFNPPRESSSYPWNSRGFRGYSEPSQVIPSSATAGQPQKYNLNVNALPTVKNTEDPNAVSLVAHVPENAQIWFDDKTTTSKGKLRTFTYPGLASGSKYSYAVRVAWVEDGKLVHQTQTVSFKPGDVQCVYLVQAGSKVVGEKDTLEANLSKLSADDRKLAEKQKFCAVQSTVQLGTMGTPTRVMLQGAPVLLCCDACLQRAQNNADATLAKAKELKAKAKVSTSK